MSAHGGRRPRLGSVRRTRGGLTAARFECRLLYSGLEFPRASAACGFIFVLARIPYSVGYATGDIQKRKWGSWGSIGSVAMDALPSWAQLLQRWVGLTQLARSTLLSTVRSMGLLFLSAWTTVQLFI